MSNLEFKAEEFYIKEINPRMERLEYLIYKIQRELVTPVDKNKSILLDSIFENENFPKKNFFIQGQYTEPEEHDLAGITAYVVDPHSEVLPYWVQTFGDELAVLLHVDDHADMGSAIRTMLPNDSFLTYAQRRINIASFIAAAVHYTRLKTVYWFNPRKNRIQVWRNLRTRLSKEFPFPDEERIYWDDPTREIIYDYSTTSLSLDEGIKELSETEAKMVLDIDLDAFCCISDEDQSLSAEKNRINRTTGFLREIPRPRLITIARSQTPQAYTPPRRVNALQSTVLAELAEVYAGSNAFSLSKLSIIQDLLLAEKQKLAQLG